MKGTAMSQLIPNLFEQHEKTLIVMNSYWAEIERSRRYFLKLLLSRPHEFIYIVFILLKVRFKRKSSSINSDPMLGRYSEDDKDLSKLILHNFPMSDDQREIVKDISQDFTLHVFSERILSKYPDFNYEKIMKLHEIQMNKQFKFSTITFAATMLSVIGFFTKTMPKTVVEGIFHWEYKNFEEGMFFLTLILLFFSFIFITLEWIGDRREIIKHQYFSEIFTYLTLVSSKK
ncbi:MAG: hypothetical protein K2P84_11220 [Undibacterium sp.]|nr:hypothetical protein [Undibacterium sp.]